MADRVAWHEKHSYPEQADVRRETHTPDIIQTPQKMRLFVATENACPTLRLVLPGHADSDRAIEIIFPEHVTVRRQGENEPEHLYQFHLESEARPPTWHSSGQSFHYERELPGKIHMWARATLADDGVCFHYEFSNASNVAYDMIYAVTDPRLTAMFHDIRLERTYVHHSTGFELLASETPERLQMPLDRWLPSRYLASFTRPIPAQHVERRADGINYYYKSQPVDSPFIATLSKDRRWVVASFSRQAGNVWSNPELTCQHVDPQAPLPSDGQVMLEVKLLVLRGSLETAFQAATRQRAFLK